MKTSLWKPITGVFLIVVACLSQTSPGKNGPLSANGLATDANGKATTQTAANVVAEFSTCSGTQYLGADGACHTAGGGASINSGSFASLPGTCTHTSTQSDLYYFTTGLYDHAICTATNTWSYFVASGFPATLPPTTGSFTAVGSPTTFSTINGSLYLQVPTHSGDNTIYEYIAAPSTPWSITIAFVPQFQINNFMLMGLTMSDGTKLVNCWDSAQLSGGNSVAATFAAWTQTSVTGGGNLVGTAFGAAPWGPYPPQLKVVDDGVNLSCNYSIDNGQHFIQTYQASETAFLTTKPTRVGISIDVNNTTFSAGLTILSWVQGTN